MDGYRQRVLKPGDRAPDFTLLDQSGGKVRLSGFKGRKLLLPPSRRRRCDLRVARLPHKAGVAVHRRRRVRQRGHAVPPEKGERAGLAALDAKLLDLTLAGHPVTVVAWVPSRLFGDAGHKEQYFRRWARMGDVRVHTKQGIWNPRDPRDRFVSTVVAGADQYYSDDVREKVVRAHDERRANGLPATGWPGFGHKRACGCQSKQPRCESPERHR